MPHLKADQDDRDRDRDDRIQHVLLLSIDGMHALDYQNCIKAGTCPHLAALGNTGVTYTRTSAARPSDSFPGLMALGQRRERRWEETWSPNFLDYLLLAFNTRTASLPTDTFREEGAHDPPIDRFTDGAGPLAARAVNVL